MSPFQAKRRSLRKTQLQPYLLAFLAVLAVAGIRLALQPILHWESPFLLFTLAIAITSQRGGIKPALFATALSVVLTAWLFITPMFSLVVKDTEDAARILLFLVVGIVISALGDSLKQWQAQAKQHEERFRLLVEGARDTAISFISPSGIIESWNEGAERIKGYQAEEIIGQPISVFYTEQDRAAGIPQKLLKQAEQQGHASAQGWRVRKDGRLFWAEVNVTALYHTDGTLRGFAKLIRDRTHEHELFAALQESEHTSRTLMEATSQAIIGSGPDGTIVLVNKVTEKMFGYPRKELIGKPVAMLIPEEVRARYAGQFATYFSAAHANPREWGHELTARKKDGTVFPIEAGLSVGETRSGAMMVSFISDITERKAIENELLRERSQLKSILDNSPVLISIKDLDGRIILANRSIVKVTGIPEDKLVGRTIFDLFPDDIAKRIRDKDRAALDVDQPLHDEAQHFNPFDGQWHTYWEIRFPVSYLNTSEPFGIGTFALDITEQKKAEENARHAAQHDVLTGLPNRKLLYELSGHLIGAAKRGGDKLAILFFDLDRFKPVNDTYGHETGDKMLQEVARRLKANVRGSDLVSRLGGDEFLAILTNVHSELDVAHSAEHLLEALRQPYLIGPLELHTSPSIGISLYPNDGQDIDTLIRHADAAMYHAKESGRNNFQFFTPEINLNTQRIFSVEQRLRHGLHENEFELFYQPILDTHSKHVVGAEALLRWPQENGEVLSPSEFIAAAETSGLINPLGNWVLHEACRQHQRWREQGLPPMRIAVNVSAIQFRSRDFQQHVADAVAESGIDPACLELEVTESTVMKQVEDAAKTLEKLKGLGLHISLDDFGTGYSSLSYLARLPIDKLKVDQSFIRNIDTDTRSLAIAETVIALGKKLGVQVVAEGIETEAALELLRDRECDLGQGNLLSMPMRADQFVEWHRANTVQPTYH